jgi:hypothetical protein
MFLLFSTPASVFRESDKARVAKGDNKNWPISISDIVPFGFDSLVEAIGQWNVVLPNPTALYFLSGALEMCGRPLFIAITTSPNFLTRFISSFRNTCTRLHRLYVPDRLPIPDMYVIATFLFSMMGQRTSQNSIMIWTNGREIELYKILSDAVTICRAQNTSPTGNDMSEKDQLRMDASVNFFHAFAFHFSPDVPRPSNLHPELAPAPETPFDPDTELIQLYSNLRKRNYNCYAAGCALSFQEVGHAYQKCGGCKHTAYCSRECQIADWKDAQFPHKAICKQLQVFFNAGGHGSSKEYDDEFPKNFNRELGDAVITPLSAWCSARNERKEIEDLRAHLGNSEATDG